MAIIGGMPHFQTYPIRNWPVTSLALEKLVEEPLWLPSNMGVCCGMLWSCFPWISPGHSLAAVTGVENLFNCIPKKIYQLNIYNLISIIYPLSPKCTIYIYIYHVFPQRFPVATCTGYMMSCRRTPLRPPSAMSKVFSRRSRRVAEPKAV